MADHTDILMEEKNMAKTKTKKGSIMDYNRIGNLFVLPFCIVFLVFNVYPVLRTLYLSFTSYPGYGEPQWNGLANYIRAFQDKFFFFQNFSVFFVFDFFFNDFHNFINFPNNPDFLR